jgi:hypothetical protein
MRRSLTIPSTLAVALAVSCAPTNDPPDAARRDVAASSDSAPIERVDGGCYSGERYVGAPRVCLPSYPATACRVARACRANECGDECTMCSEVFRCFPQIVRPGDDAMAQADGATPRCDSPALTCDRYGCEPGCQTIPAPVETGGGIG